MRARIATPAALAAAAVLAAPLSMLLSTTAGAATAEEKYSRRGFGLQDRVNPVSDLDQDRFTMAPLKRVKVGDGRHNINWNADPHESDSWKTTLHMLNWTGGYIYKATQGMTSQRDPKAIDGAVAVASDWVRDNKYPWATGPGAGNATHTRADFLICLRGGFQQLGKPVPKWLDASNPTTRSRSGRSPGRAPPGHPDSCARAGDHRRPLRHGTHRARQGVQRRLRLRPLRLGQRHPQAVAGELVRAAFRPNARRPRPQRPHRHHVEHPRPPDPRRHRHRLVQPGRLARPLHQPRGPQPARPRRDAYGSATKLLRKSVKTGADFYQFSDTPVTKTTRTRSLLVLSDPDIVIAVDKASAPKATSFTQYWHLPYDTSFKASGARATASAKGVTTTLLQLPAAGIKATSFGAVKGSTKPIQGWQWTDYFHKYKAPVATVTQKVAKAAMVTAVVASPGSTKVGVSTKISGSTTTYTFKVGAKTAVVTLDAIGALTRLR